MTSRARIFTYVALLQVVGALLLAPKPLVKEKEVSTKELPVVVANASDNTTKEAPVVSTAANVTTKEAGWTFPGWYNAYTQGRGIWKWSNAIDAYQRHLAAFVGQPIGVAEVGVQSGGSLTMWHSVLGAQCHLYGLDINPESTKFQSPSTTIVIGDQENAAMWRNFFATIVKTPVSIMIDDGGHTPGQMLVTLQETYPKLTPSGVIAIEDIHGLHYVDSFFSPAAEFLGAQAKQSKLSSVHVYPFQLVASREHAPAIPFPGPSKTVDSLKAIWDAVPNNPGGHIIFQNPGAIPFLNAAFMKEIFAHFGSLHAGSWTSIPDGCHATAAPVCTVRVTNTHMQSVIVGVHIYADRLVVDVAANPPVIEAVRHGTQWVTSYVER